MVKGKKHQQHITTPYGCFVAAYSSPVLRGGAVGGGVFAGEVLCWCLVFLVKIILELGFQ